MFSASLWATIGTLRCEDRKPRRGTAVDARNFVVVQSRHLVKDKIYFSFRTAVDVNNLSLIKAFHETRDTL